MTGLATSGIPETCVLDPDGEIVRSMLARGEVRLEIGWVCCHTQRFCFSVGETEYGIVSCAVGPSDYSDADAGLIAALDGAFDQFPVPVALPPFHLRPMRVRSK